jgi:8-oxo-dGTP pyrophosphatase MutT (NUDIX family)
MTNKLWDFLNALRHRLQENLPGKDAHTKMAPRLGDELFRSFEPSVNATPSSVLLLLVGDSIENLEILFTLRSSNLPQHSNQISFPGGHRERDETVIDSALRETEEEIGIPSKQIEIIGLLSALFVPPSDTIITPVVGYLPLKPEIKMNLTEVSECFFVQLNYFLDERNVQQEIWDFAGNKVLVPLWKVHPRVALWGATAMILAEFTEIVKEII